jgi:hypothetical protein
LNDHEHSGTQQSHGEQEVDARDDGPPASRTLAHGHATTTVVMMMMMHVHVTHD